jgi:deazaflavin-dependent oxidoreductase (nitroreductase family)
MPAPRWVARFNRSVTNRLTGPLAPWLPGFGVVIHTGRRTGTRYRTPVNVFSGADGGFVIALTYGPEAEWVRNVLASGGCALQTRGRTVTLSRPRLVHDPRQRAVPPPVRVVLGLLHVSDFLRLELQLQLQLPLQPQLDLAADSDRATGGVRQTAASSGRRQAGR